MLLLFFFLWLLKLIHCQSIKKTAISFENLMIENENTSSINLNNENQYLHLNSSIMIQKNFDLYGEGSSLIDLLIEDGQLFISNSQFSFNNCNFILAGNNLYDYVFITNFSTLLIIVFIEFIFILYNVFILKKEFRICH